ncbi:hypothetical protein ACQ3G6_12905 [Allorhizobium undicola]|uniref:hypothetical protein n=1 Tax=Allorhizobium undicola TaxID=78527 RepID=UPI003D3558CC
MSKDEKHLQRSLAKWLKKHYSKKDLIRVSMDHYGFLRSTNHSKHEISQRLRAAQVVACEMVGPINPKLRLHPAARPSLLLDGLDKVLSITIYSSRILLKHISYELRKGPRGLYEIPDDVVRRMREEIGRSVPLKDAAKRLGCSAEDAEAVAVKLAKKGWQGCIQTRNEDRIERRFLAKELEKLEEVLRSLPVAPWHVLTVSLTGRVRKTQMSRTRLMAEVLRGAMEAYQDPSNPGLANIRLRKPHHGGKPATVGRKDHPADAMLWSEFNAMTNVDVAGIKRLVELGHLTAHPDSDLYILRESAVAFRARYVNPTRILKARGLSDAEVKAALLSPGLVSVFGKEISIKLVERARFEEWLGEPVPAPDASAVLWKEFVQLGQNNCPSFIIPELPGDGQFTISTTSRVIRLAVVAGRHGISITAVFDRRYRRTWSIYERRRKELIAALESFRWREEPDYTKAETVLKDVAEVERVTKEIGRLTNYFRYKMP